MRSMMRAYSERFVLENITPRPLTAFTTNGLCVIRAANPPHSMHFRPTLCTISGCSCLNSFLRKRRVFSSCMGFMPVGFTGRSINLAPSAMMLFFTPVSFATTVTAKFSAIALSTISRLCDNKNLSSLTMIKSFFIATLYLQNEHICPYTYYKHS